MMEVQQHWTKMTLTKRQNKLGDKLFKKLAMLKVNQHYW